MLPAHRKTSEDDKYQMKTIRKSGIPTSCIYDFFATQIGGYENIGYSRRDMYNEKFKGIRVKSFDTNDALDFLNGMCDNDYMMYLRHTVRIVCFSIYFGVMVFVVQIIHYLVICWCLMRHIGK